MNVSGDTATAEPSLTNVDVQTAMKETMTEFEGVNQEELAHIYVAGLRSARRGQSDAQADSRWLSRSQVSASLLAVRGVFLRNDSVWATIAPLKSNEQPLYAACISGAHVCGIGLHPRTSSLAVFVYLTCSSGTSYVSIDTGCTRF